MRITSKQLRQIIREEIARDVNVSRNPLRRTSIELNESMDLLNMSLNGIVALGSLAVAGSVVRDIATEIYSALNPSDYQRARMADEARFDREVKDAVKALSDDPTLISLYQDLNDSITLFGGGPGTTESQEVNRKVRAIENYLESVVRDRNMPAAASLKTQIGLDNKFRKRRVTDYI